MSVILDIERMTLEEKLQTMDALWADLSKHEENIPVPQRHKDLLDERALAVKEGRAKFMDWETAKKEIADEIRQYKLV